MGETRKKWKLTGDDALYLVVRKGRYYVQGTLDGQRIRKACGTGRQDRAELFMTNLTQEYASGFEIDYSDPNRDWKTVAKLACERQEASAKKRGIPFKIKPGDVYVLMKSSAFKCAVSGIPLAKRLILGGERDPWAPSIDRIESRHGYTIDNVRVVCLVANLAMNAWGQDVLLRLARGILYHNPGLLQENGKLTFELTPNKADTAQVIDITKQLAKS